MGELTVRNEAADAMDVNNFVTQDIIQIVKDSQLLVSYVVHEGEIEIDEEALSVLVKSKYLIEENKWTLDAEILFWKTYDRVMSQIKPVTIESIKSNISIDDKKAKSFIRNGKARSAKAVTWYRFLAVLAMASLLLTQIYWVIGTNLTQQIGSIFDEREAVRIKREKIVYLKEQGNADDLKTDPEISEFNVAYKVLDQKLDSNYELLCGWNRIWQKIMFKDQFVGKVTDYVESKYDRKMTALKESKKDSDGATSNYQKKIDEEENMHQLNIARNRLFLSEFSAEYVLIALQIYLLPLLYGFLGAVTFVLRTLSVEIRNLTYTRDSEIKYRLRLSLGALAGMAIGWFFKPEDVNFVSSLSPFAIAFLAGYNVDVLFSIMDKMIEKINNWINSPAKKSNENKMGGGPQQPVNAESEASKKIL